MSVSNGQMGDDSIKILNPFVHKLELEDPLERIKTALLTILLLPFRVICICVLLILAWLLACIGLWGISNKELISVPLTGWRRKCRELTAKVVRYLFWTGSFHYITVKGEPASAKEAPLLCVAPHSSFFDAIAVILMGPPAVVAKAETAFLPFFGTGGIGITVKGQQATRNEAPVLVIAPHSTFLDSCIVYVTNMSSVIVRNESMDNYAGKLINFTQPIYVWRDDPNSRQNTIKSIIDRANSNEDWPQILIFPEGTCTNRSCLITFKPGAFYPGVPIQPVCIRYPNKVDTVTWTWEGPGVLKLLWLTLTQFHSSCEIEFLPIYNPSKEEKENPKLFAHNVRTVMAKALNIPVSEYTFDDVRRLTKCKLMNNPYASSIVEIEKLRMKAGLSLTNIEEQVINLVNDNNCNVTLTEFALRLQIQPSDPATIAIFNLFQKNNSDVIDFREYLLCALFLLKISEPTIVLLKCVFKMYDNCGKGPGRLNRRALFNALRCTIALTEEESDKMFAQIDVECKEYIDFDNFRAHIENNPKYAHLFTKSEIHQQLTHPQHPFETVQPLYLPEKSITSIH